MKKLLSILALIIYGSQMQAQVGMGTTTPKSSAILDVDVSSLGATNKKGVLLPQVELLSNTDVVTIPNPAPALVVFNTKDNNVGNAARVFKNTFYFWNGSNWTDITNMDVVREQLLPQVFSLSTDAEQVFTVATINNGSENLVTFDAAAVRLNTGNRVTLSNNLFKINTTGKYEFSGSINYNPSLDNIAFANKKSTNLEFVLQKSTNDGITWTNIAKTITTWGYGTGLNNRSLIIAPVVLNLTVDDELRCIVKKTAGDSHSAPAIRMPTGLGISKVLKIQKID